MGKQISCSQEYLSNLLLHSQRDQKSIHFNLQSVPHPNGPLLHMPFTL